MDGASGAYLPDGPRPALGFGHVPDRGIAQASSPAPSTPCSRRRASAILASPPQAPRANAICERIIGTLRRELFDRSLIVNEHHLRRVLTEYLRHYNTARPHRALGQFAPAQAPTRPPQINLAEHRIRRKQVLGGLTSEYQIAA